MVASKADTTNITSLMALLKEGGANDGVAIAMETERLAEKYGDSLTCEDITQILKIGTNNARQLMNSRSFPTIKIGKRKVVPTLAYVKWSANR